jgi:hypothetical protein
MRTTSTALALIVLAAGGCQTDRDGAELGRPPGTQGDGGGAEGDGGGDEGDGDDGDGDGGDGGGPTKFDLGNVPDAGELPEETGCQKVDLLFVIDDSGSMSDNQQNLVNSFPGFADLMMNTLQADKFNVGVVTSDSYAHNEVGCTEIGSLVTKTSSATCTPFVDGQRYMTQNDNLGGKFACAGLVGDNGDGDEHQLEGGTLAISPAFNAPGACNEGFIRSDALLVLVIITDEDDDDGSPGDPPDWFNAVAWIKGDIEQHVVVLSLLWGMPNNVCHETSGDEGVRIREFTNMFTYGFIGDSCAPDYSPFFEEAILVIDDACDNFTPPG